MAGAAMSSAVDAHSATESAPQFTTLSHPTPAWQQSMASMVHNAVGFCAQQIAMDVAERLADVVPEATPASLITEQPSAPQRQERQTSTNSTYDGFTESPESPATPTKIAATAADVFAVFCSDAADASGTAQPTQADATSPKEAPASPMLMLPARKELTPITIPRSVNHTLPYLYHRSLFSTWRQKS